MKYLFIVAAFTLYSLFVCSTLPSEFNDALDGFSDEIAEQEFSADVDENTAADLKMKRGVCNRGNTPC